MPVTVVNIRIMGMGVFQPLVAMRMGMRLSRRIVRRVPVLVMLVVNAFMFVVHRLMNVPVRMNLGQMQPHTCCHQHSCHQE